MRILVNDNSSFRKV